MKKDNNKSFKSEDWSEDSFDRKKKKSTKKQSAYKRKEKYKDSYLKQNGY